MDGQDGLDKAVAWRPDLILIDLVMPGMDGFEAVRRLRRHPSLQTVPIIALSASVFEHDRQESLQTGCDDFVAKPVNAADLLHKIGQILNLEWRYEPDADPSPPKAPLIAPPREILASLFELAQKGQIAGIHQTIDRIEALGEPYFPFALKLRALADAFQVEEICAFLTPFIEKRDV